MRRRSQPESESAPSLPLAKRRWLTTLATACSPLLNLQSALGYSASPTPSSASVSSSSFGVKRRWDDDVIFKNQARGVNETPKREFVNDLLRTEFHKRFLKRFIA